MAQSHNHMFGSTDHADSAGQAWAGREFNLNPFAGDDGSADPQLLTAIESFRSSDPSSSERAQAHESVNNVLRNTRLLIPLLADAGEVGISPTGLVVDKTQELAIVTVAGPSGQKVLPVFSCVEAMQSWNPQARPVPVESRRAALAAAADGAQWMVLDPGFSTEWVIRRPALEAIAQNLPWIPPYADTELAQAFASALVGLESISGCEVVSGDSDARGLSEEITVKLFVAPGLSQEALSKLLESVSRRWSEQVLIVQRVDSMKIQLVTAT